MNLTTLRFKYENENVEFMGELKYQEGKLINFISKPIYEFNLKIPFEKTFTYTGSIPANGLGRLGFSKIKITLENIKQKVIDEVLYYYFNHELEKKYQKLNEEYFQKENKKYEEFAKPYLEKIEKLKEKQKQLKKEFKIKKLTQKEYQFKRKELQQNINEIDTILFNRKQQIKSPYFECNRLKKELQHQYNIDKVKIKWILTWHISEIFNKKKALLINFKDKKWNK